MVPLTEQVKSAVREAILAGELKVGERLPSSGELASRVKCSPETVTRALTQLAAEGLVRRIRRRGTVVAMRPRAGRVCLALSGGAHTNLLLQGPIYWTLTQAGYLVDVIPTFGPDVSQDRPEERLERVRHVHERCRRLRREPESFDCFVAIEPRWRTEAEWAAFSETSALFPRRAVFAFGNGPQFAAFHLVTPDHRRAARLVVKHLLEMGHRKIAAFAGAGPEDRAWPAEAAAHCRDLLDVAGGEFVPHYPSGNDTADFERLFKKTSGVTAYWAVNDFVALQAVNVCHRAGIRVPEDVSVVGRFDTPWGQALTTVSIDPEASAAAVLAALGGPVRPGAVTLVEPHLLVRGSTGPPSRPAVNRTTRAVDPTGPRRPDNVVDPTGPVRTGS